MPDMEQQKEMKEAIEKIGHNFHEFKKVVEQRNEEIKKYGEETAELKSKIAKLDDMINEASEVKKRLDAVELAAKRGNIGGDQEVSDELREYKNYFFDGYLRGGNSHDAKCVELAEKVPEFKAMRVNSDPDGGYFVDPDTSGRLITKLFETSPIRPLCAVQTISTDALEGMTDLDELDCEWEEDEQEAIDGDSDTPQIGKYRIPVHGMGCRPRISQKLLEDSSVDLQAWLINKATEKFGRFENTAFVDGNGVGKPRGFTAYTSGTTITSQQVEQVTTAASNTLDDVDLMETVYTLKAGYRANAVWGFNRTTIGLIRRIQDDDGLFVWQPGLQAGEPDRLNGYPVVELNDLGDVSTDNAIVGVFADWMRFYQIVDRIGMSVLIDPYSVKPLVELYCRRRVGGGVTNFEAGKLIKAKA